MERDVIVIGGGPSGMAASWVCAKLGFLNLNIQKGDFLMVRHNQWAVCLKLQE
ncbi:MAG: hypothetical protein NC934_04660 [Candidatus Omnitrophica bacterium]|nr:hypothetical protein [Candidatus Omnitrophota bacterium]